MKNQARNYVLGALLVLAAGCAAHRARPALTPSQEVLKAVRADDAESLAALLGQGVDPNIADADGKTALMLAAQQGNTQLVRLLLDHAAKINATGPADITALGLAAENGYTDIVKILLDEGARNRGPEAYKALMLATAYGHDDVMQLLLSKGFPAAGPMTQQILDLAKSQGYSNAAQMLEQARYGVQEAAPAVSIEPESIHSDVDEPTYRVAQSSDNYAVVVGIEEYAQDLPQAFFARRDAQAVKKHLIALGYPDENIKLLTGKQASRAALSAYLEDWLPKNVKDDGTVFFYFSGHGAADAEAKTAYLVPYDGDPSYLSATGFPMNKLYADLQSLKAAHVIVALDSCFSGSGSRSVIAKGTRPLVSQVQTGDLGPGKVVAFTASAGTQIAGVSQDQGHGLFTYYFLKGLNGEAMDSAGDITVIDLYMYLKANVEENADKDNRSQTPQLLPPSLGNNGSLILRVK